MARRILHTAVGDEIRRVEQTDPERAAEMRMESMEYANEVRGFYDYDEDPADCDEMDEARAEAEREDEDEDEDEDEVDGQIDMPENHHVAPEPVEEPPYCDRCGFAHGGKCPEDPERWDGQL